MKITIFYLLLFFLLSCGQANDKVENKKHTSKQISPDSSTSIKQSNAIDNETRRCQYDNEVSSLGIGLIKPRTKFDIYDDSLLNNKFANKNIYSDSVEKTNLCSKFYMPDYGIMYFVCLGKTQKAFKILVNFSDIKYLPNTADYKFESWNDHIIQSFGIRRLTNKLGATLSNYPLRKEQNEESDTLTVPEGYEMFCPIEMKGDWIKVKYDCFYNKESNPHEGEPCHGHIDKCKNSLIGWLRWREDNKLLIEIFLIP